jgi:hypothetical protein
LGWPSRESLRDSQPDCPKETDQPTVAVLEFWVVNMSIRQMSVAKITDVVRRLCIEANTILVVDAHGNDLYRDGRLKYRRG